MKQCTHGRNGKCVLVCVSRRERERVVALALACVWEKRDLKFSLINGATAQQILCREKKR